MKIALREHDAAKFQAQKDWLLNSAEEINRRWGCPAITVAIKDQYFNMRSVIDQHMEVVEAAKSAFEYFAGVKATVTRIYEDDEIILRILTIAAGIIVVVR